MGKIILMKYGNDSLVGDRRALLMLNQKNTKKLSLYRISKLALYRTHVILEHFHFSFN